MDFRPWVLVAHVLSVIGFFMIHGVSAAVVFRLRKERDRDRIRTLLDLSGATQGLLGFFFLIFFFSGLLLSFMGSNLWTSGALWLWASLAILILTTLAMSGLAVPWFNDVRLAVGAPSTRARKPKAGETATPPPPVADDAALEVALSSPRGMLAAWMGIVAIVVITYLMIAKPF